jgi:flagellar FliL protein
MTTPTAQRTTSSKPGAGGKAGEAGGAKGEEQDGAKAKGNKGSFFKSKKFLIAVVGVLVVGGGAYKFAMPHKAAPPTGGDVVPIDAMTVNLAGGHYLKVAASVQLVKGKASATDFDVSQAAQALIDEFSNRTVASISTNTAREKLRTDLVTQVKKAYPGEVFDVFLTQFVSQ